MRPERRSAALVSRLSRQCQRPGLQFQDVFHFDFLKAVRRETNQSLPADRSVSKSLEPGARPIGPKSRRQRDLHALLPVRRTATTITCMSLSLEVMEHFKAGKEGHPADAEHAACLQRHQAKERTVFLGYRHVLRCSGIRERRIRFDCTMWLLSIRAIKPVDPKTSQTDSARDGASRLQVCADGFVGLWDTAFSRERRPARRDSARSQCLWTGALHRQPSTRGFAQSENRGCVRCVTDLFWLRWRANCGKPPKLISFTRLRFSPGA